MREVIRLGLLYASDAPAERKLLLLEGVGSPDATILHSKEDLLMEFPAVELRQPGRNRSFGNPKRDSGGTHPAIELGDGSRQFFRVGLDLNSHVSYVPRFSPHPRHAWTRPRRHVFDG